jgi:hypothetical protein
MRKLNLGFCILLFISLNSFGQVIIDSSVKNSYEQAFKKVVADFPEAPGLFDNLSKSGKEYSLMGYKLYTQYKTDTLNKKDCYCSTGSLEISDYDPKTGKSIPPAKYKYSDGNNTFIPGLMVALLKGDSVHIADIMAFEPVIHTTIAGNTLTALYVDYRKSDSIFRTNPDQPKSDRIQLPMKVIRARLSDNKLIPGNTIYGEVELETPDFYEDNSLFSSGYIRKRLHVKYVFKSKIITEQEAGLH